MRQSGVSHTSLACLWLKSKPVVLQHRFYRNFEPRRNPMPRCKAHQNTLRPLCGPKPGATLQAARRILYALRVTRTPPGSHTDHGPAQ